MNDLDTLRSAFAEKPAPATEVVAAARTNLAREISGTPASPRSDRFGTHRLGTALTVGTAAVTVTALAVPLFVHDQQPPPAPPVTLPSTGQPLTASQLLLAAAEQQERAEPTTGRHYRVRTMGANRMTRIGTGPSAYTIEQRWVHETWTPASDRDRSWFATRYLGARPATAADREKWRAAGSPTRWNLGPTDTEDQHDLIITAAPDKGRLESSDDDVMNRYTFGSRHGLTAAQVQALPTDEARLRKFLLRNNGVEGTKVSEQSWLFAMATALLVHAPAPPKLRGTAFRILAGLPDIRNEGETRDMLGRTGTSIALTERASDGTSVTYRLLVDRTGRLLRERVYGPKSGEHHILAAGWTNETPRIPGVR